jgi:hypothetical protein
LRGSSVDVLSHGFVGKGNCVVNLVTAPYCIDLVSPHGRKNTIAFEKFLEVPLFDDLAILEN